MYLAVSVRDIVEQLGTSLQTVGLALGGRVIGGKFGGAI